MDARWSTLGIVRTMLPVLLVLTLVELGSGLVLDSFEATLLRYPALLVLVPVTIGMAGNLGSVLAARLSTVVHLGLTDFEPDDEYLLGNAAATLALAVTLFPLVGAGGWLLQSVLGATALPLSAVVAVALVSGVALALLAVVVTGVMTYVAYRFGLDPDDIVIPVVTNVCDVLGVVVLVLVVEALI